MILANFQISITLPPSNELLKIIVRGSDICSPTSLRKHGYSSSGPGLLVDLSLFDCIKTSSFVMFIEVIVVLLNGGISGLQEVSSLVKVDIENLFSSSAMLESAVTIELSLCKAVIEEIVCFFETYQKLIGIFFDIFNMIRLL